MIKLIVEKIKNMIKAASISSVTDDSSEYPQTVVNYMGKTTYAVRMSPYGLCSNPPTGSLSVLLSSQGQESVKYALQDDMPNRFKNLAEGEVVVYNYMSGSYAYFKANGDIDVYGTANLNAEIVGDATVNIGGNLDTTVGGNETSAVTGNITAGAGGNIEATAGGEIDATATTSATVTAPLITLAGNVVISGTLNVNGAGGAIMAAGISAGGNISTTADVSAGTISLKNHVHTGVQPGSGNTGGPI